MIQTLRELAGQHVSVELAYVIAPPVPGVVPQLVQLALQPGNRPGEGRVAYLGAGPVMGVLTPLVSGTEVLVLVPGNDLKQCVVLGALHSVKNPIPPTWLGLNLRLQHPGGVEMRTAEGLPADGVVLGNFLVALQAYTTALTAFTAAVVAGVPGGVVDPVSVTAWETASAAFGAALATSASFVDPDSGGVGGPPFASALNRATT